MKIVFIQYDSNSNNLTNITNDDKFNDASWTPTAVDSNHIDYLTNNYQTVKYDTQSKALIYPDTFTNNLSLINANATTLDNLNQQSNNNANDLNDIKYKTAWNHLMQIFTLPDDLPFLNRAYGISTDTSTLKVASFNKTGTYVIPAWASVTLPDAPSNTDYTKGLFFTIYHLGDNFVYVRFTNSIGTYINQFAVSGSLGNWKQVEAF